MSRLRPSVDKRLRREIVNQRTVRAGLGRAACIVRTVINFSSGSTEAAVSEMRAEKYSPADPGIGLRPSRVRTTNPSPHPVLPLPPPSDGDIFFDS